MRDEIDGRLWDEHGHAFSESLDRLVRAAGAALRRLYRFDWDAPWHRAPAGRSRAGQA